MTFIIAFILVIATLAFVGYPLLSPRTARHERNRGHEYLIVEKAVTRSLVEELELDYEMGNISEEDYHALASRYGEKSGYLPEAV